MKRYATERGQVGLAFATILIYSLDHFSSHHLHFFFFQPKLYQEKYNIYGIEILLIFAN